jgi:glycosyltransferase involved in cell wall biosynthesis
MKKITLAIVSDTVYPFNKGGKEKRLYDITTRLVTQGYDVTIYCMQLWEGGNTFIQNGVTLHAISPYYPLYAGNRRSIKEAVLFAFHCLKLLNKKFDVVEIDHMPHLVLFTLKIVCLLRGKRMIVVWHEVWGKEYWKKYLGVIGILAYWIERVSAKLPDTIISVSNHTTNGLRNVLGTRKKIVTIPNGLDMANITRNVPAASGADIVFAGRLLAHKNVDVLLHATSILAKQNPKISLFIIGEGPEKPAHEKLADELGIKKNVSFFGFFKDHNELYRIMQASKVFVLPSTREGFGLSALEANACGMPVVTIDHEQNAVKEFIINNENGTLSALNENELAGAIAKSIKTKKHAEEYRKYAEKYDWSQIIPTIQNVYAE